MEVNFKLGQFYGDQRIETLGSTFDVRDQSATTREEDVQVHTHLDAHFVFVLSGLYISSARGADEYSRAPTLIFNPPGTTHRDRFVNGIGTFVTVSIGLGVYHNLISDMTATTEAMLVNSADALASAFRVTRGMRDQRDAAIVESSAWEMVLSIDEKAHRPSQPPNWAIRAYESIMDRSIEGDLDVRTIAADVNVHPVHVARVFRQSWGCSPGELIRWRRVDQATDLLRRSRMSAADIAAVVGFVDQSHMTRAFRATYGVAPGCIRRGHVSRIQA